MIKVCLLCQFIFNTNVSLELVCSKLQIMEAEI